LTLFQHAIEGINCNLEVGQRMRRTYLQRQLTLDSQGVSNHPRMCAGGHLALLSQAADCLEQHVALSGAIPLPATIHSLCVHRLHSIVSAAVAMQGTTLPAKLLLLVESGVRPTWPSVTGRLLLRCQAVGLLERCVKALQKLPVAEAEEDSNPLILPALPSAGGAASLSQHL
jgi:hypothetical protein